MPAFVAKRFVLEGKVQGVGCRAQIQEIVENLGHISGYVRNLSDGSVEVCAKGPSWRMEDLEKVLKHQLSSPIQIRRVRIENIESEFTLTGFRILRD